MKKILRPYLFISLCGIIAFAPVSFMLRALKNDIVALEYPINHFISQCIRNGELPYWFNTWGMGFPLQSNLTWGIYSTPQLAFSAAFNYNIYVLHIEFLFFILLSGWSMFHLLRTYLVKEEKISLLLAICYMLSGFMVGSSQWLLYITAAAFIPLVISALLKLLQTLSLKNSLQVAVCYTLMFTSVYAAFNIITSYSLILFILFWVGRHKKDKDQLRMRLWYLLLTAFLTALLCFPCLYFTLELLNNLDRGNTIAGDVSFFNSNYLHPGALSSMLFPFSSVKMGFANTEGTMLNTYVGLFILALLPLSGWLAFKEKNKPALLMLFVALFFLLISFGDTTLLRKAINVLPGFSYFRNPAIFRFYFIITLIFFAAVALQKRKFEEIINAIIFRNTVVLLSLISLLVILLNTKSLRKLSSFSLSGITSIDYSITLLLSAILQLLLMAVILVLIRSRKWSWAPWVFAGDLVFNTLICTPFFTVSSYSLPEVNAILRSESGFRVQQRKVGEVPTTFTDARRNTWQNVNVFTKEVSTNNSYRGPLVLKDSSAESRVLNKPLIFSTDSSAAIAFLLERPTYVKARIKTGSVDTVTLLQNYYPGWKAFVNGREVPIIGGASKISVAAPAGERMIEFRYERKLVWMSALFVHLVILLFGIIKIRDAIKATRSASPS
ncbi:MAG TPA: hypothetical protein VMZ03_03580 [Chitinophagaceae bacterium]|nr:hypothetical protein [Chitinophagaceae bacterium]